MTVYLENTFEKHLHKIKEVFSLGKSNIEVVHIENVPDNEYHVSISTDKEKERLIKRIERIVRKSGEYRDYIMFLRQNLDMDSCAFFNNITKKTNSKIRIEVHHEPLTLYDITKIILEKYIETGEEIDDLMIAEEVAEIHYKNQVGLIPLSKTLHEVVHNSNKLVIPMYMISGNYMSFLRETEEYWKEDKAIVKKLELLFQRSKELNESSFDVLKEKFIYLDVDGFELPVKIEDKNVIVEEVFEVQQKAA